LLENGNADARGMEQKEVGPGVARIAGVDSSRDLGALRSADLGSG
jgi:hypothetical protein